MRPGQIMKRRVGRRARNRKAGEDVLSYHEACVRLRRHPATLYRWLRGRRVTKVYRGRLGRNGKRLMGVLASEVAAILAARKGGGARAPAADPESPCECVVQGAPGRVLGIVIEIHLVAGK